MKNFLSKRDLYLAGMITEGHYNLDHSTNKNSGGQSKAKFKNSLTSGLRILKSNLELDFVEINSITENRIPIHTLKLNESLFRGSTGSPILAHTLRDVVSVIYEGAKGLTQSDIISSLESYKENFEDHFTSNLKRLFIENNIAYNLWTKKLPTQLKENFELPPLHTNSLTPLAISTIANLPSANSYTYEINHDKLNDIVKTVFIALMVAVLSKLIPTLDLGTRDLGQLDTQLKNLQSIFGNFNTTSVSEIASQIA